MINKFIVILIILLGSSAIDALEPNEIVVISKYWTAPLAVPTHWEFEVDVWGVKHVGQGMLPADLRGYESATWFVEPGLTVTLRLVRPEGEFEYVNLKMIAERTKANE